VIGRSRYRLIAVFAVCLLVVSASADAAPGDLDPTFGVGGVVTTDIGPHDSIRAVVVQPDGKILAAGAAFMDSWALARYLPDGSPDPGFGIGGHVTTAAPAGVAFSLALGPTGTIVAAGFGDIVRYLPNGALDQSFGTGGRISIPGSTLRAIVVMPDSSMFVAGDLQAGRAGSDFFVARVTSSGALDGTFGSGGKVVTDLGGHDLASELLVLPDGKLLAVGETVALGSDFALVRYLPDGSPDPSFGSAGKVITDVGGPNSWDHGDDAVLTADGKIVVTGASFPNMAFARYLPNGALDQTFGVGGIALSSAGEAWSVVQQSDGKLVVTTGGLAAARFTASGAPDSTFGTGGIADSALSGSGSAVALDTDARVIVAGGSEGNFTLVRFLGASPLDTTPPELIVPSPIVANATSPAGAEVSFTATATDDTDASPRFSCAPPSGSVFAIGTTVVRCTATDSSGNVATATFTVHVKGTAEQLADVEAQVRGVGPGTSLADKLRDAQLTLRNGDIRATCSILGAFGNQVDAQTGKTIPPGTAAALTSAATRIKAVIGC
jgi:uncharacterized delta-60 repeat protein